MSKITDYLRQHLTGEVVDDNATRKYFASDEGIFTDIPLLSIYPRTTNDVRKAARFSWRLAERGTVLPLVARGFGKNRTASAIGSATLVLPAHMSSVLEIDPKLRLVRTQPGLSMSALNEVVATHGLKFMACDRNDFATIGGLIASNSFSRKLAKYGPIGDWVERLEVVLSNGEVIQTGRLSRKELNAKKGLQTMEGEIYRALDSLLDDNLEKVKSLGENLPFAINQIKSDDGSFDLTPLFIGSEGGLGVITQMILKLESMPYETAVIVAALDRHNLSDVIDRISELEPSEFSFIDGETLEFIEQRVGDTSWKKITDSCPTSLIFIELDGKKVDKKIKKMNKIFDELNITDIKIATDFEDQEELYSIRESTRSVMNFNEKGLMAPAIGDSLCVQASRIPEFIQKTRTLLAKHHLSGEVWGEINSGVVNVQPILNPTNLGHKQAMLKMITELREAADEFSAPNINQVVSGRLGSLFIENIYDKETLKIFVDIKTIFDPFGILNPGVKFGSTNDELMRNLKNDFSQKRFMEM